MPGIAYTIRQSVNLFDAATRLGINLSPRCTHQVLCPFHLEQNPSARIYVNDSGPVTIFCWACGKTFDVLDLVQHRLGTDFNGAVEWIKLNFDISNTQLQSIDRIGISAKRLRGGQSKRDIIALKKVATESFLQFVKSLGELSKQERYIVDYYWNVLETVPEGFTSYDDWFRSAKKVVTIFHTDVGVARSLEETHVEEAESNS